MTTDKTSFEPLSKAERLAGHEAFLAKARACTNVGETGDERDLYVVVDEMLAFLQGSLPDFACKQGCNHCCHLSPAVSSVEWAAILAHVQTLPAAVRRRIVANADLLRGMAWVFDTARRQASHPTGAPPISADAECPFLVDERCSIYAVRPLKCRGYGYSMVRSDAGQKFFGSFVALLWIREHFHTQIDPRDVILPLYDEYQAILDRLNAAAGGDEAFLAQWVWANVEAGDFVTAPRPYVAAGGDPA